MPEIVKLKKKKNYSKHGRPKEIAKLYNSTRWVKLRNGYLMQNPLCERCLEIISSLSVLEKMKQKWRD